MRRVTLLCAVLALIAPLLVAISAPPAGALPAGCHKTDKFGPGLQSMKHFIYCTTRRAARVVWVNSPAATQAAPTGPASSDAMHPNAGGPPCYWLIHEWAKVCYPSHPEFECIWYDNWNWPNGEHCAPLQALTPPETFEHALWRHVKNIFKNHVLRRCAVGAIGSGGVRGVILRLGGKSAGGPVGVLATTAGGCVAGALSYWFH